MRQLILITLLLCVFNTLAQDVTINQQLMQISFEGYKLQKNKVRKLLTFKRKHAAYNPLNYAGAGLLFFYQNVISEQIQADCVYQISCSQYTKLSIQNYGFITGLLKGFNQLSECHGGAVYEHAPININGNKIINTVDKED